MYCIWDRSERLKQVYKGPKFARVIAESRQISIHLLHNNTRLIELLTERADTLAQQRNTRAAEPFPLSPDDTDDEEIEITDPRPSDPVGPSNSGDDTSPFPSSPLPRRSLKPSLTSVSVLAWIQNSSPARSLCVELPPHLGSYLSLSDIAESLRGLGLTRDIELDRFIRGKGWRRIGWSTFFPIGEKKLVVLKAGRGEVLRDWDMQLEHMYE